MSESITVDAPGERRRRLERPERAMTEEPEVEVLNESGEDQIDAETALADAQKAIQQRDTQLAHEREARTRAEREAQRAHAGRATDRSAAVAAAVEAAKADQNRARQAKRIARESGDLDGEIKAEEDLANATYRAAQAAGELASMQSGDPTSGAGQMQERAPQQQQGGTSAAAQAWIVAHPRFNSDRGYKAALIAAHTDIVNDGIAPDTPAYFRELDKVAASLEPTGGHRERNDDMAEAPRQQRFSGAPPSRGNASSARGNTLQTELGPITAVRRRDGSVGVDVPQHARPNFEDGAKVSGMKLGDYIYEQYLIAEEKAAGGNGGMIMVEDRVYR